MRLAGKCWHSEASDCASRKPLEHTDLVAQSQILQPKGRARTARTGEPVGDRTVRNIFQNVNTFFLRNPLQQVTPDSMGFTRDQWKMLWNKTLTHVEQEVR